MERYNDSDHGYTGTYLVQDTKLNPHLTTPSLEQIEAMDNLGAPEFFIDQALYYPTSTNYGYYCTGFESPGEWNDHHRFFGLDGQDIQYTGLQAESLPYVYYTPSHGFAVSPYNPYNPHIPGAIVGVDGSFIGTQQYYTGPTTIQNSVSSPAFFPIAQSRPDIIPNSPLDPWLLNTGASNAHRPDGPGSKHNPSSASVGTTMAPPRPALGDRRFKPANSSSHQIPALAKIPEGSKANMTPYRQPDAPRSVSQGRSDSGSIQATNHFSLGRVSSLRNPLKVPLPVTNGLSHFGYNARGWATVDKLRLGLHNGGSLNNENGSPDVLSEQNRGPRTNRAKNQSVPSISGKAYMTQVGASDAQGNIIIYADQYNKEDFPVDYVDAKFFVIKSYSEDDVHKSIKYNVWSSTPNGNKRLDSSYEDAQRNAAGKAKGCPVFLFFSVNASGQFCGVAEMIGPVDFHKDMDFWQQDKWSGSFPVNWHIVKDVPNTNFRHIILENNENKPVTNSRDTQEIRYKQGVEMLKIFKNHKLKTSLLDDFIYYEERQKIMQEEKARLLGKSYDSLFFVPTFVPSPKPSGMVDLPPREDEKTTKHNDPNSKGDTVASTNEQVPSKPDGSDSSSSRSDHAKHSAVEDANGVTTFLKIGSLTINPKQSEAKPSVAVEVLGAMSVVGTEQVDIVTVGSMPVKVNRFTETSSGSLSVGTTPLNPKALKD
ncbi:hypothetical protein HHK36_012190 [Tetracentron sinense]|uniref:YTH domain-containing family protein n=1 Tax=Tetracentron sinense TaxID=13715 RepID=A0A834Z9V5_TETSI|nr:hypothetical protein HHK36_012190 [Tetracentron sinense]